MTKAEEVLMIRKGKLLYQNRWLLCTAVAVNILEYEFKGKRCHCYSSAQVKKKKKGVLYDTADYIFPWDISVTSAESALFFLHSFGI